MPRRVGVLVMAYGTPRDLDEVPAYYAHIRHGRPPPDHLVEELRSRYRAIGGTSPLLEITDDQARGIAERAGADRAYVGYKHCAPFIEDAVSRMYDDGIEAAAGIVMAPHYSAMSIGEYSSRALRAAEANEWGGRLEIVKSWHLEPKFIEVLARRVRDAFETIPGPARDDAELVFTAHSLPEKVLQAGDPYPAQLQETAREVAAAAGIARWSTAWQSAGRTDAKWLGPDLCDVIATLPGKDVTDVVVCPCGFVSDHLEILYDVDIEARAAAEEAGIRLVRTSSPNADDDFLDAVGEVARRTLAAIHVTSR